MRVPEILHPIHTNFAGTQAKEKVAAISRYHRIQASPGYRDAATWLLETLHNHGIEAELETFPAVEDAHFWSLPSFQEWDCQRATLDWIKNDGEERLCDYSQSPLAIIQRSTNADGIYEVIDVGDGEEIDYANLDVTGKLVLSRSLVRETYQRAVIERRAAGVLFDHVTGKAPGRSRDELPAVRQYASFWWQKGERKSWGFVLTPTQGDALRRALARGEVVRVRAHIETSFYDGEFEVVKATIPGTDAQSVLGMAHLCHPQGFANDNASGAACLLQTAITLHDLILNGQLPPPRRPIHFLWMPEMTGTYAWLEAHEDSLPEIIAGLNLDMVGEDQTATGSVFLLERPPESMASFAPDLAEAIRDELLQEQLNLAGTECYPLIPYATTVFSGGSDHTITSDPLVGIPTPMLIQWPDRYYHTTADTMEKVDPASLKRAGALAGTYLYWLAQAYVGEATWLGWELIARFEQRLSREIQTWTSKLVEADDIERQKEWSHVCQRVSYRQDVTRAALATLVRLADVGDEHRFWLEEVEEIGDRVLDRSRKQIRPRQVPSTLIPDQDPWRQQADQRIPVRHYRGPIMDLGAPAPPFPLSPEDTAAWRELYAHVPDWRLVRVLAEFWCDGRRTLAQIADLVEMETGRDLGSAIESYFTLLSTAGQLSWHDASDYE